jgi:hypothetical protein
MFRDLFMNVAAWWEFCDEFFKNVSQVQLLNPTIIEFYHLYSLTQLLRIEYNEQTFSQFYKVLKCTKTPHVQKLFKSVADFYKITTREQVDGIIQDIKLAKEMAIHANDSLLEDFLLASRQIKFMLIQCRYGFSMLKVRKVIRDEILQDEQMTKSRSIWDIIQYFDYILLPQRFNSHGEYMIKELTENEETLGDQVWKFVNRHPFFDRFSTLHVGNNKIVYPMSEISVQEFIVYITERVHWSRSQNLNMTWKRPTQRYTQVEINWFWLWVWRTIAQNQSSYETSGLHAKEVNKLFADAYKMYHEENREKVQKLTFTEDLNVLYDLVLLFYRDIAIWRAERLTLMTYEEIISEGAVSVPGKKSEMFGMRAIARLENLCSDVEDSEQLTIVQNNLKLLQAHDAMERIKDEQQALMLYDQVNSAQGYYHFAHTYKQVNMFKLNQWPMISVNEYRNVQTILQNLHDYYQKIGDSTSLLTKYDELIMFFESKILPRTRYASELLLAFLQGNKTRRNISITSHDKMQKITTLQALVRRQVTQIKHKQALAYVEELQSTLRGKSSRTKHKRSNSHLSTIQSLARGKLAQRMHERELIKVELSTLVQALYRARRARRELGEMQIEKERVTNVTVIESLVRRYLAQNQVQRMKEERMKIETAAVRLQTLFRSRQARKQVVELRNIQQAKLKSVVTLQSLFRVRKAKQQVEQLRNARNLALSLQSLYHARNTRLQTHQLREETTTNATMIQSLVRSLQVNQDTNRMRENKRNAIVAIQSAYRAMRARQEYEVLFLETKMFEFVQEKQHRRTCKLFFTNLRNRYQRLVTQRNEVIERLAIQRRKEEEYNFIQQLSPLVSYPVELPENVPIPFEELQIPHGVLDTSQLDFDDTSSSTSSTSGTTTPNTRRKRKPEKFRDNQACVVVSHDIHPEPKIKKKQLQYDTNGRITINLEQNKIEFTSRKTETQTFNISEHLIDIYVSMTSKSRRNSVDFKLSPVVDPSPKNGNRSKRGSLVLESPVFVDSPTMRQKRSSLHAESPVNLEASPKGTRSKRSSVQYETSPFDEATPSENTVEYTIRFKFKRPPKGKATITHVEHTIEVIMRGSASLAHVIEECREKIANNPLANEQPPT